MDIAQMRVLCTNEKNAPQLGIIASFSKLIKKIK